MQIIDAKSVVGIAYVLKGEVGEVLDKSTEADPFVFLMGVEAGVPGLEKELLGKRPGDEFTVTLQPDEAYGAPSSDLIGKVTRDQFPPAGGIRMFTIRAIEGDMVTIDANHEMAGKVLTFAIKVLSVREASEEEIAHKHVHHGDHGDHDCGHHHHHH
jgi:FKBP-type peptidyl-prolyl cis-trans isomerase SlyD